MPTVEIAHRGHLIVVDRHTLAANLRLEGSGDGSESFGRQPPDIRVADRLLNTFSPSVRVSPFVTRSSLTGVSPEGVLQIGRRLIF